MRCTHAKFAIWTSGSSDSEARKSTDHHSEQSVQCRETCRPLLEDTRRKHPEESQRGKYRETCRGNVEYRIPGVPHSTVQKENTNRKESVKRLIQQFENHPNRDSLMKGLNRTAEFNPFSEKSKELITIMCNTEYFELCETSSKIQCPDSASCWEAGMIYCACGKFMQPTERNRQLNEARYDVLSIPWLRHQEESYPRCQTWTICATVHVLQST